MVKPIELERGKAYIAIWDHANDIISIKEVTHDEFVEFMETQQREEAANE